MSRRFHPFVASLLTLFASLSLSLWAVTAPAVAQTIGCGPDSYELARVICPPPSRGYVYVCADQDSELPSGVVVGCTLF